MAWTFDEPSGTFRNFELSDKIRHEALANTQFMQFATTEPGFGKHKGESTTITRFLRMPLANIVGETDRLPPARPPIQTKQVGVQEWGIKVPMTQFELNLSKFNLLNEFQSSLRDNIRLTMDIMVADAAKLTPIKYVPTAASFILSTNGVAGGLATSNLRISDLREIKDYLSGTLKSPPYRNGRYVGILSTRAARGIKNDAEYKDWQAPHTMEPFMSGEFERPIEGFTLLETNNFGYERDALDNLVGTSTVLGEAIFFGADTFGLLEVDAPEIRMGLYEDLGRYRDVGWVGTISAFHVWEAAAMARAVHVTST